MVKARKILLEMIEELDRRIGEINDERIQAGDLRLPLSEMKILGQMSLLVNEKVSAVLFLAQTGDVDALLKMEYVVKKEMERILEAHHFKYDEDSHMIWVPPGAQFDNVYRSNRLLVQVIDPESALVSKAIKAPEKNKQLIRQAIAEGGFPNLAKRIAENKGNLKDFL